MNHLRTLLPIGCIAFNAFCACATNAYISIVKPETCGNANGELIAGLQGGIIYNPLSYAWSTGATTQTITGLAAGSYSVTVTDAQGTPFVANVTLNNSNGLPIQGFESPSFTGMLQDLGYTGGACEAACNGIVTFPMVELGGTAPFNVSFDVPANNMGTTSNGHPMYGGFCASDVVNYTLTDAFGCSGTGMFLVVQIDNGWNPMAISTAACDGADIGSITVSTNSAHNDLTLYFGGVPIAGPVELFGGNTHTFEDLAHGMYELLSVPDWSQCATTQQVVVDDLGPGCTVVEGDAWYDQDADCVQDAAEVGVPGSVMVIQPGTQYAITGADGHYSFTLPAGNYTIAQTNPTLVPYCPAMQPVPFTVSGPIANIDFANNSTAPLDLRAHINSTWARPGFPHSIYGSSINSTMQVTGAVEVIMTIDPTVVIGSVTPTPTTTAGNVLTWQIAELDYFGTQGFSIMTTVPVGTPLGTVLNHSISVSSMNTDANLSDNIDSETRVVQASFDPNDKTATTSSRQSEALYYIDEDEWIDYTIRFQNTGTAEAIFITITDTLPEELDMTTFQMALASHGHTYTFKPGRVVEWFFEDIMLPDSTTDLAGSQGFVKFRIKPVQPLLAGTVIENVANIYFDFNPPVITEPSVLTAEFSTGMRAHVGGRLVLSPVPAHEAIRVSCNQAVSSLQIIAANGRVVLEERAQGTHTELNIGNMPAGVYLLRAKLVNGTEVHERFIKQ